VAVIGKIEMIACCNAATTGAGSMASLYSSRSPSERRKATVLA
jgi:hypothetical protein